jgi:hypothetical protein
MSMWIDIDAETLSVATSEQIPTAVGHHLEPHPLLTLEAIAELAAWLPRHCAERNDAAMPLVLPGGGAPRGGVEQPQDVVRTSNGTTAGWCSGTSSSTLTMRRSSTSAWRR